MVVLCGMQYSTGSARLYLIGGSLGPPLVLNENGILIASAFFCRVH